MIFDELYKKYYRNVLRIIKHHYKGVNNDDLMDISQMFWVKISKIEIVEKHFITFSFVIIKNLCNDFRRDNKKYDCHVDIELTQEKYEKYFTFDSDLRNIEYNDKVEKIRLRMTNNEKSILDLFLSGHNRSEIEKLTRNKKHLVKKTIQNAAKIYQKI